MHFNKPGQNISLQISELAGQDESLFENAWMLMVININSQVFSITPVSNVNKFLDKGNCFGLDIVQRFEIKRSLWTAEFKIIMWSIACKGQLILKCPFGVFKSSKKPTKFFPGFLP